MLDKNIDNNNYEKLSLIEISYLILKKEKKNINFYDLILKIKKILKKSDNEMKKISFQLFTDLNIDGKFVVFKNIYFGLKEWFSLKDLKDNK